MVMVMVEVVLVVRCFWVVVLLALPWMMLLMLR